MKRKRTALAAAQLSSPEARKRRFALLFFSLLLVAMMPRGAQAQATGSITGVVTDAQTGEPLPGVNVALEQTLKGAATDIDGVYTIAGVAPGTYQISASFLGFRRNSATVTVVTDRATTHNFALEEDLIGLDEIVVTGQGSGVESRRLSTTVEVVTAKQLSRLPGQQIDQLLQSALPSAAVRFSSGLPGSSSIVRARGITSANSNTTPVIYVDGVRVDNLNGDTSLGISTGGNESSSLADIPIENIERIEFIKGGAATTLYGSDAANGVIQIFTKKGLPGRTTFAFETTQGARFATTDYQRFQATDNLLYRSGHLQTYRLSGSGGTNDLTYSFSGSMTDDNSYRYGLGDVRYNLRTTVGAKVTEATRYTGSFGFSSNRFGRVLNSNAFSPYFETEHGYQWDIVNGELVTLYDEVDAALFDDMESFLDSVRLQDELYDWQEDVKRFQTSQALEFSINPNWKAGITAGVDYRVANQTELYWTQWLIQSGFTDENAANEGDITRVDRRFLGLTFEGTTQYQKQFGDLSTVTTLGGQVFRDEDEQIEAAGASIADGSRSVTTGATQTADDFALTVANYGLFVAENIGYKDRYFLEFGLRGDGNSAFGDEVGIQYYPKVGGSYAISSEPFFSSIVPEDIVSYLKLRANYGVAGKFPDPFENERTITPDPFVDGLSYRFGRPGDATLRPEKTYTYEFGGDIALFDGKANFEFTYYNARTEDALFNAPFNPSSGQNAQLRNLGEIENKGYEISTTLQLASSRNFDLRFNGSINYNENLVLSTGGAPEFNLYGFTFLGRYVKEGLPVGYLRGTRVHLDRVDENGDLITGTFEDGGAFESNAFLGNPTPSHWGSLGLNATFFNRLNVLVSADYQWGGSVINLAERYRMLNDRAVYGQLGIDPNFAEWADRDWKQRFLDGEISSSQMGDVLIASSDFLKVRLISLGYRIPERYVQGVLSGLELRASIENPFGVVAGPMDPELSGLNTGPGQGALNVGGYAYGADSLPRTFSLTVKTTF